MLLMLPANDIARSARNRGFSMIELMVSMVISLMILAGLVTFFANNNRERNEIQRANQQTENGQYALQVIGDDLHEAGYLSTFNPQVLSAPAADPDPCATSLAALGAALPIAVQGYYNYTGTPTLSCLPADYQPNSDILVIRRAGTCAVNISDPNCPAQVSGAVYFQASGCNNASELGSGSVSTYYVLSATAANFTLHERDCTTIAPLYPYEVHIYYVATQDKTGDGIPTLKRIDLDPSGAFASPVAIAEGIDYLKIDYGLDPGVTGSPTVFTPNPYAYNGCAGATCLIYWQNTAAAQVYVLAQNTTRTPGYATSSAPQKTFYLGTDASGGLQSFGPYTDGYKRHVYEAEFRLYNVAGRNTP
jgi:type IV pilus assembly protein PilW